MNSSKKHFKKIVLVILFLLVIGGTYLWFVVFPLRWPRLSFRTGNYNWLSFWGSYISFVGTITLGYVAYWQSTKAHKLNEQSQKIQKASLVAEHAAVITVDGVSFDYKGVRIISLNQMFDQVLLDKKAEDAVSASTQRYELEVTIHAEVLSGFVSLVEVRGVYLTFCGKPNEKGESEISSKSYFKKIRDGYSAVAITHKNRIAFTVSLLMDKGAIYDDIKNNLQRGFFGFMEIELDVVTFTNVMSTYMCRINFSPSYENADIGSELIVSRRIPPMTFWQKSELIDKEKIIILGMEKQENTAPEQTQI